MCDISGLQSNIIIQDEINLGKMAAERDEQKRMWEQSSVYLDLMDILDAYWLSEPEEMIVEIDLHFVKANGEEQFKNLVWTNSKYEDKARCFRFRKY